MNDKNIFKGTCYMCPKGNRENKFIVKVDSWKSQNGIRGSWRMTCNDCCKKLGWEPNRFPNKCVNCKKNFIGKKSEIVCSKCLEAINGSKE